MELEGRKVLVTGAGDCIGRAIAELFAEQGARVIAVDRDGDKLAAAFERQEAIIPIVIDITDGNAASSLVQSVTELLGRMDILVNNAGIPGDLSLLKDTTDENWRRVFSVNVDAVFQITRAFILLLRESRSGRIIITSSVCAELGLRLQGAYVASKHAVSCLMKGFAIELGAYGITANCINPANTVTGITRDWFDPPESAAGKAYLDNASVLGRYSQPLDLAKAALYLASDGGAYVTGQSITDDGGMTCRLPSLSHEGV